MIAYIRISSREWAIADINLDAFEFMWWCGEKEGWVSPYSSHWQIMIHTQEQHFTSGEAARRYALAHGFEKTRD